MNKTDISFLLEEKVYTVFNTKQTSVNTLNGVLNDSMLQNRKAKLVNEGIIYLTEDLVNTRQEYPQNDISDVTLTTDFVVINRKDFDKIKTYINELS